MSSYGQLDASSTSPAISIPLLVILQLVCVRQRFSFVLMVDCGRGDLCFEARAEKDGGILYFWAIRRG